MIGLAVLWILLYGYVIIASIDFGAGFYAYYARWQKKEGRLVTLMGDYLSPVWEVTNIFFIFFIVGIVALFPETVYYYGTALLIPGIVSFVLLAVRGSFYAFEAYGSRESKSYLFVYALTGLLIPASLSTMLTVSEGGFLIEEGTEVIFLAKELLTSSYSWSVVFLAIVSVLFISATFLTYYASRANDSVSLVTLRKFALFWSLPTLVASGGVFIALKGHNLRHYEKMLDMWWVFAISFFFFLIATFLIYQKKKYGTAFLCVMFQFLFAFFGYGIGHLPYILEPFITVDSAISNSIANIALCIIFVLGSIIMIPPFYMLIKSFFFPVNHLEEEV
ncbi:cytochrome d ubiquinol oxidase subunit II [Priestia taiwanensis]|uniref:Cytochrome D ubiquinol oxidase subunit II n=1 Tax=Priestia taiwanensis TaxID=1347902 RepID=A0A917ARV1_9BACI|nr:cytochrome d ubiquinol oxidase subunit II [Priestia taiwanensis]MBM7364037.1 cytochrome d ubiquinol oxidase subunit II [Priestia taiwanensis]GGE71133.1 cytochrome D ubiquinol oxidase subunit II [Priestia taiwanensis]